MVPMISKAGSRGTSISLSCLQGASISIQSEGDTSGPPPANGVPAPGSVKSSSHLLASATLLRSLEDASGSNWKTFRRHREKDEEQTHDTKLFQRVAAI